MFLRATLLFLVLFFVMSCSEKEDPAPVDKLVGSWSVTEVVTFNEFTGMSFDVTALPTATYNATIKKATSTSIQIEPERTDSPDYDYKGNLTVDWEAKTITVEESSISGTITDENNFTVTYIWGISSGYYSVERTYSR